MRILADECCPAPLVKELRAADHDVLYVIESAPLEGAADRAVLERAYEEGRLVLTEDKDFGELVYRLQLPARGVILLRFDPSEREEKVSRLVTFLDTHQNLSGRFVVITSESIRIRPLLHGE